MTAKDVNLTYSTLDSIGGHPVLGTMLLRDKATKNDCATILVAALRRFPYPIVAQILHLHAAIPYIRRSVSSRETGSFATRVDTGSACEATGVYASGGLAGRKSETWLSHGWTASANHRETDGAGIGRASLALQEITPILYKTGN